MPQQMLTSNNTVNLPILMCSVVGKLW